MRLYRVSVRVRGGGDVLVLAESPEDAEAEAESRDADEFDCDITVEETCAIACAEDLLSHERTERLRDRDTWVSALDWLNAHPADDDDISEEDRARAYRLAVEAAGQQRLPCTE